MVLITHRHSIYNVVGVWVGWTPVVGQLRLGGSRQSHIYVLQPAASFEAINRWRGFECLCSIAIKCIEVASVIELSGASGRVAAGLFMTEG